MRRPRRPCEGGGRAGQRRRRRIPGSIRQLGLGPTNRNQSAAGRLTFCAWNVSQRQRNRSRPKLLGARFGCPASNRQHLQGFLPRRQGRAAPRRADTKPPSDFHAVTSVLCSSRNAQQGSKPGARADSGRETHPGSCDARRPGEPLAGHASVKPSCLLLRLGAPGKTDRDPPPALGDCQPVFVLGYATAAKFLARSGATHRRFGSNERIRPGEHRGLVRSDETDPPPTNEPSPNR